MLELKLKRPPVPDHPPVDEPVLSPAMKARLDELAERCAQIEHRQKQLTFEWEEWYDKFRLLFARLSKRIKHAEQVDAEPPQSRQDAPESTISPIPRVGVGNYGG